MFIRGTFEMTILDYKEHWGLFASLKFFKYSKTQFCLLYSDTEFQGIPNWSFGSR